MREQIAAMLDQVRDPSYQPDPYDEPGMGEALFGPDSQLEAEAIELGWGQEPEVLEANPHKTRDGMPLGSRYGILDAMETPVTNDTDLEVYRQELLARASQMRQRSLGYQERVADDNENSRVQAQLRRKGVF